MKKEGRELYKLLVEKEIREKLVDVLRWASWILEKDPRAERTFEDVQEFFTRVANFLSTYFGKDDGEIDEIADLIGY